MEDIDIWRTAELMRKGYGETAWLQSSLRADKALAAGDTEGFATWRRVVKAVEELDRTRPKDGESKN